MTNNNTFKLLITIGIILLFVAFIVFNILYTTTENIVFGIIGTVTFALIKYPLCLKISYELAKNNLNENTKRFLAAVSAGIFASFCFEIARIVVSPGENLGVLLFPVMIPVLIWAYIYYFSKTANNKKGMVISFLVGIPLLLLSIYFEVYDFLY